LESLSVTLVQYQITWENPPANFLKIKNLLKKKVILTDLIILPEMFSTGFTMNVEKNAEKMNGKTIKFMKQLSLLYKCAVCGSVIIKEDGYYFNRFIWTDGKEINYYNKKHLFSFAGEKKSFTPGNKRIIIKYKNWEILPQICYDLRFPVWSRNKDDYDLIIYVANWPERRSYSWKYLLVARAIENQSYVIGVNRTGNDFNNIYHSGDSSVIAPDGKLIITASDVDLVLTVSLDKNKLIDFRRKFPFLKDRDEFVLK